MPKTTAESDSLHTSSHEHPSLSLPERPSTQPRTLLLGQVVVSACFFASALSKLAGTPKDVAVFGEIGAGQWFRYVSGAIEALSAVLLLVPACTPFAALVLSLTAASAAFAHALLIGGSPLPAAAFLVASGAIVAAHRAELAAVWESAREEV
jgi:hypothetical protein